MCVCVCVCFVHPVAMVLYVARIVSFCFPHVVDLSALSICIVLCALLL